jgi:hypothetical protein
LPRSEIKSSFTPSKAYSLSTHLPVKLSIPRKKNITRYYDNLKKKGTTNIAVDAGKNLSVIKNKIDKIDTFRTFIDSSVKHP